MSPKRMEMFKPRQKQNAGLHTFAIAMPNAVVDDVRRRTDQGLCPTFTALLLSARQGKDNSSAIMTLNPWSKKFGNAPCYAFGPGPHFRCRRTVLNL